MLNTGQPHTHGESTAKHVKALLAVTNCLDFNYLILPITD